MSVLRAWHPGSAHTCWTLWSVVLLLGLDLQLAPPCTPQGPGRPPPPQLSAATPPRRPGPWWSASLAVRSRSWMDRRMGGGQSQPRGRVSPPHLRHISLAGFTLAERALKEMGQPLLGAQYSFQNPVSGVTELPGCPGNQTPCAVPYQGRLCGLWCGWGPGQLGLTSSPQPGPVRVLGLKV